MQRELEISMRFCTTCLTEHPYTEFYKVRQKGKIRMLRMCKACKRDYNAKYRKIDKLKMRAAKIGKV